MCSHGFQTCLGIPIPMSMKGLVSAPPVCLPTRGDHETIEIIEKLGKDLYKPEDEVTQARNLGAGLSDIVIILERPLDRQKHKFDVSFEDFIKSCDTLLAVDELIRFATKGARSIHTVTVVDAFSYQPDRKATEPDKQCHEALAQILRSKKPKVILRCHRDAYCNEWLKRIELPGDDYQLKRKEITIVEDHKTVVLQSFHPSCAVNNANCRPEYRALLMYHFVAAFSELRVEFTLPKTAEEIRKLCLIKGERRDIPSYKSWQAARRISEELEKSYDGPSKTQFIEIADETPSERRSTQIEAFNALYRSLGQLFGNERTLGGLSIAKIVLFLWKKHFREDPLYDHVMSWLLLRGNEQQDWFLSSDRRPLEQQLLGLQISNPPTISDAASLVAKCSAALVRGEDLAEDLRAQIIDASEKLNRLISEYLGELPMSDINHAMHIRNLLIRCEIFLSAISEHGHTPEKKELYDAVGCLRELKDLVDATWAN